jgi:hypothetical protein
MGVGQVQTSRGHPRKGLTAVGRATYYAAAHVCREIQHQHLSTDKRLDVYARAYLTQLMRVPDDDLPRIFGVNWKKHPSVKLVPKDQRPEWDRMGCHMRAGLEPLLDL